MSWKTIAGDGVKRPPGGLEVYRTLQEQGETTDSSRGGSDATEVAVVEKQQDAPQASSTPWRARATARALDRRVEKGVERGRTWRPAFWDLVDWALASPPALPPLPPFPPFPPVFPPAAGGRDG